VPKVTSQGSDMPLLRDSLQSTFSIKRMCLKWS